MAVHLTVLERAQREGRERRGDWELLHSSAQILKCGLTRRSEGQAEARAYICIMYVRTFICTVCGWFTYSTEAEYTAFLSESVKQTVVSHSTESDLLTLLTDWNEWLINSQLNLWCTDHLWSRGPDYGHLDL